LSRPGREEHDKIEFDRCFLSWVAIIPFAGVRARGACVR